MQRDENGKCQQKSFFFGLLQALSQSYDQLKGSVTHREPKSWLGDGAVWVSVNTPTPTQRCRLAKILVPGSQLSRLGSSQVRIIFSSLSGCSALQNRREEERAENFLNSQNAFELGKVGFQLVFFFCVDCAVVSQNLCTFEGRKFSCQVGREHQEEPGAEC